MKPNADTRGAQLQALCGLLEGEGNALIAGDFNFCSSWPAENDRLDRRYRDLWASLRPGEPGYTQDTAINTMLARAKGEVRQVRIDRILLRSDTGRWTADSIRLIGEAPIEGDGKLFASDHFGLLATLRRESR
jgi:tyrosyl-DNA phosphodiesterase 2